MRTVAYFVVKKILNYLERDSNIVSHIRAEMPSDDIDEMQKRMNQHLVAMGQLFSLEGHSGLSASYAISVLNKLLNFEPLGPLTGEDSEWLKIDFGPEIKYQNKRCSSVFKREDGTAYHIERNIFKEPDGCCFTGSGSREDITFPYTPERVYIDVDTEGNIL